MNHTDFAGADRQFEREALEELAELCEEKWDGPTGLEWPPILLHAEASHVGVPAPIFVSDQNVSESCGGYYLDLAAWTLDGPVPTIERP